MPPDGARSTRRPVALVIDDSEQTRKDARRNLLSFGFDVMQATDAETALRLCMAQAPALILVDWLLPSLPGAAFLRALRGIAGTHQTAVIFLSVHGRAPDIHVAMRAGASEYLMKPFDADLLAFKLQQVGLLAA